VEIMTDSFDQLKIDTPEQIALELPLAGIGSRFLAIAIDTLLQGAIAFLVVILCFVILGGGLARISFLPRMLGPALGVFILFAIYWGYFAIFESLWNGQTPGKRLAGIRVIKESGRPINAFEAMGRNFLRVVDFMPGFYGVGLVCMMCNRQSRRLGDFVAGTVVVHEKPTEEIRPTWSTAADALPGATGMLQMSAEELVLIETYLSRRFELDPEVRLRTAIQIADRIKLKTGLEPQPNQHVDDFLEEAARTIRDASRFQ
jgi:uncharacterized RDD family membrane protein YckC